MNKSIFEEKSIEPTAEMLNNALKGNAVLWEKICDFVVMQYPAATKEWNYSGVKYGWSFRIKDKKRAIIYLLPRDGFFKAAFVFGQKAYAHIQNSEISEYIKRELSEARVYAEGIGIRIDVSEANMDDVMNLVKTKLMF